MLLEMSRRLPRYHMLAALMDCSLYVLMTAATHRALEETRDPHGALALVAACWAIPYVLTTALGGGLTDRYPRPMVARAGASIYGVAGLILALTVGFPWLLFSVALVGVGLGMFWPALQAMIADASVETNLEANLGNFNVAWSLGKALGFLAGGWLYATYGSGPTLALAAGFGIAIACGVPRAALPARELPSLVAQANRPAGERRLWRHLGWIANFGAWGLGATVIHLYPELNRSLDRGSESYGMILMTVYLAQTAAFLGLRFWRGWVYRPAPLVAAQLLGAGFVATVAFTASLPLLHVAAAGIGIALGVGYYSSITYSLRTDRKRGRNVGRHEATLGSANFLLPLAGGALARTTGSAGGPYVLAAGVVAACVLAQIWLLLRRRSGEESEAGPGVEGESAA
jgi:MFS family permease